MEENQDKKLSAKEKAKKFRQEAYQKAKAYQKAQKERPLSPEQQAKKDQIKEQAKLQRKAVYLKAKEHKKQGKKEKNLAETQNKKESQPAQLDFGKLKLVIFDEEKQIFKPASQPPKLTLIRCETE